MASVGVAPSPTGHRAPREAAGHCKMEGGDAQVARERPAVWARRWAGERKRDVAAIRGEDGGGEVEEPREATALADARRMGVVC
jgi:hypothetical protein